MSRTAPVITLLSHAARYECAAGATRQVDARADLLAAGRLLREQAGQTASVVDATQQANVERRCQCMKPMHGERVSLW